MKFLLEVDTDLLDAVSVSDLIEKLCQLTHGHHGEVLDTLIGTVVAVAVKNCDLEDREGLIEDVQEALEDTFDAAFEQLDKLERQTEETPLRTLN